MTAQPGAAVGGRYVMTGLLGRGGMAEVYLGRDLRLDRPVALKVLRPELAGDATYRARFHREALSVAALNHPHVVAVYDTGEDHFGADGTAAVPYLVTEYVDGLTLAQLLDEEGPLPPEQALALVGPVLDALAFAHAAGIVHRDIKPANVMVTRGGTVKVMDFGIARSLGAATGGTLTARAMVVGTPEYISPEQARGDRVDTRTDLYSAGCLLYELLTGGPPFLGDSAVAIAFAQVEEEPQPPSRHAPAVPRACDELVLKALAKDRDLRFQTATEMRAALDRVRATESRSHTPATRQHIPGTGQHEQPRPPAGDTPTQVATPPTPPTAAPTLTATASAAAPRPRRRPAAITAAVGAVVLAAGAAVGVHLATAGGSAAGTAVQAPDLVGSTLGDARRAAARDGVHLVTAGLGTCTPPTGNARAVCVQSPAAGSAVSRGGAIRVQVSRLG
jgi:serine/threonine protein kinase